jgi:cytoskeletal protein CcmA (bactofilin family)
MRSRWSRKDNDEAGVALVLAVAVAFIVVLVSATAISQSENTLTQSNISGQQVTSIGAAEGGLQSEINSLESAGTTIACPSATTYVTGSGTATTAPSGATGFGTQVGSYTIKYATGATAALAQAATPSACPAANTIPYTSATYYLFQSSGATTETKSSVVQSEQALLLTPAGYQQSSGFPDATYAGTGAVTGTNNTFSVSGGDAYSESGISCGSADTYTGSYVSSGYNPTTGLTAPSVLGGGCSFGGSVYLNGSATFSAGLIGGDLYATGTVALSGGANVTGSVYAAGSITSTNTGKTIGGNVETGGSYQGGASVAGNVYAAGAVNITGGTITGNIYAAGTVTISGGSVTGSIYSGTTTTLGGVSVTNGHAGSVSTIEAYGNISFTDGALSGGAGDVSSTAYTISQSCTTPYRYQGPLTCAYSLSNYPANSTFVTYASILAIDTAKITAASLVANPNYSNGSYPYPALIFDPTAWTRDTSFCPAATATVPCATTTSVPLTCNVRTASTPTNAICIITDQNCTAPTQYGLNTSSIWQVIANMEVSTALPTVLVTDCQLTAGQNPYEGYSLPLYNNLAIFDTKGFWISNGLTGGITSPTKATRQLYIIDPSSTPSTLVGSSNTAVAPVCAGSGPDINVQASLSDGYVQDFLYTPNNICANNTTTVINGKVYAGGVLTVTATKWTQTLAAITPWVAGGAVAGAVTVNPVQWIRRVANS